MPNNRLVSADDHVSKGCKIIKEGSNRIASGSSGSKCMGPIKMGH